MPIFVWYYQVAMVMVLALLVHVPQENIWHLLGTKSHQEDNILMFNFLEYLVQIQITTWWFFVDYRKFVNDSIIGVTTCFESHTIAKNSSFYLLKVKQEAKIKQIFFAQCPSTPMRTNPEHLKHF